MAISYLQVAVISRAAGGSAGASAAYITGQPITITRYQQTAVYAPDDRIQHTEVFGASMTHQELWDKVETHHKRKDALLAYKMILALPHELTPAERIELARTYTETLTKTYGVAASMAVHTSQGAGDNWHAHLQWTACSVDQKGNIGKKVFELDPIWCKRNGKQVAAETMRAAWTEIANDFGTRKGMKLGIDMRSYKRQGSDKIGQLHEGNDRNTDTRKYINQEIRTFNEELEKNNSKSKQNAAKLSALMGVLNDQRGPVGGVGTTTRTSDFGDSGSSRAEEEHRPFGRKPSPSASLGELDRVIAEERRKRDIKAGLIPDDDQPENRDDQQGVDESPGVRREAEQRSKSRNSQAPAPDTRERKEREQDHGRGGGYGR